MIPSTHYPEPIEQVYEFRIPKGQSPERLDVFLTQSIHNATRNKVQTAIDSGRVLVNGKNKKASYKIAPNDYIICKVLKSPPIVLIAEDLPLNIIYEDEYLLVVNKPAGLCVHPGVGNRYGTLVNALLFHFGIRNPLTIELPSEEEIEDEDDIITIKNCSAASNNTNIKINSNSNSSYNKSSIGCVNISNCEAEIFNSEALRPHLVHRIDKDTTGLLVVAKNAEINMKLSVQFANKTTQREYNAIVWGKPKQDSGTIEGNIGRSLRDRKSFAVLDKGGKPAITDYEVIERFAFTSLVRYKLRTGRTHQIRVHSGFIGHKLFGDVRYGGNKVLFGAENPQWRRVAEQTINKIQRQMLHAKTLGFIHPITQQKLLFSSELPEDMHEVIKIMRKFSN